MRAKFVNILMLNLLAGLVMLSLGCATINPITPSGIRNDMEAVSREIAADRSAMNKLRDKRVGKTGFYYILDSDSKVVFHPQSALIGSNFSKIWFIDRVLTEKSGCFAYTLGNRMYYLFFSQLNDSEILCLSIISDDLRRPEECRPAEFKSAE